PASMLTGNLLALLQQNVKRILAYSSIAHLGYLLVAVLASGPLAVEAVTFYVVAYFITTLGAFGVVTVLSRTAGDADSLEDYRGLFWRRPWLSAILTLMLLSLAGIPLTAGFIGKFYVIAAGVNASLWGLVILLVITSVISVFYYLRIIVAMTMPAVEAEHVRALQPFRLPLAGSAALALLTFLLVWFGVYPDQLIRWIQTMVAGLGRVTPFASL
ncbi:MAG: NADH-quinone oxidoreductase subunit N, partial [Nitrospiraceae bacterium]